MRPAGARNMRKRADLAALRRIDQQEFEKLLLFVIETGKHLVAVGLHPPGACDRRGLEGYVGQHIVEIAFSASPITVRLLNMRILSEGMQDQPSDAENGPGLETALERELFERGSIDPPARALLHDSLGLDSVHGQLLTATDLLALQHVQMDAAGFGSFWPVVEHALLSPNQALEFELAAGLKAQWRPDEQVLSVEFRDFGSLENADEEAYRLWQRALRTLTALCGSHGLQWQPRPTDGDRIERDGRLIISTVGPTHAPDGAARHIDEDIGLIAWSVVENGFLKHIYPLDAGTARDVERSLREKFSDLSTLTLAELKT